MVKVGSDFLGSQEATVRHGWTVGRLRSIPSGCRFGLQKCSPEFSSEILFSCGSEAPATLVELNVLLLSSSKKMKKSFKTAQTNMVAYVIWAINFKSEVRSDLRGCLEAIVASKSHFLCLSPID